MSEYLLTLGGLTAGYGGSAAVADVTLTLRRGEILCLVGESGCGKSTLLKAILGTTPGLQILSGSIVLDGEELTALPPPARRQVGTRKIGMVFQNPGSAFNPIRTYKKQFIETLRSHGLYSAKTFSARVEEAFAKFGLEDCRRILDSCPYEMSGGMNQRIAVCLSILLADEPTSALDATIQLQVAGELRRLRDESGIAQIVVTHNLALAGCLGDRIGVMDAGRLVELGAADSCLCTGW